MQREKNMAVVEKHVFYADDAVTYTYSEKL